MEKSIHCAFDELVPIGKLSPHPKNPNAHPEKQVEVLARIIDRMGWRVPITVSNLSGFIIRGHGRLLAAKRLGFEAVPVDYQEYESESDEMADLVADNQIPELSKINTDMLASVVRELKVIDFDLDVLAIPEKRLEKLLKSAEKNLPPVPQVEFSEELHESHNYVVLKFSNDVDWLQAQTLFGLKTVKALDSKEGFEKKGVGRVLDGPTAIQMLRG